VLLSWATTTWSISPISLLTTDDEPAVDDGKLTLNNENVKWWLLRALVLERSTVNSVLLSDIDGTDTRESTQYDWLYSAFCWKNCPGTL
jgi:hypothetical protein